MRRVNIVRLTTVTTHGPRPRVARARVNINLDDLSASLSNVCLLWSRATTLVRRQAVRSALLRLNVALAVNQSPAALEYAPPRGADSLVIQHPLFSYDLQAALARCADTRHVRRRASGIVAEPAVRRVVSKSAVCTDSRSQHFLGSWDHAGGAAISQSCAGTFRAGTGGMLWVGLGSRRR